MQRADHLRRFRGGALFLLVIQTFALAAGGVQLTGGGAGHDAATLVIGALFILVPALMVWNGSRLGGVLLILIMAAVMLNSFVRDGVMSWSIVRGALYLGLSVWMLRELMAYHKKSSEEDAPIEGSAFIRWSGATLVGLLGGFTLLGLAETILPDVPTSGLLTGRQISGEQYRWMYENDILGDKERIFLFSADAGKPYSDGGNVLTDHFVGGWWREDDGELESGWIKLGEICRVEKSKTASDVNETLYTIYTYGDDSWLRILLPKAEGGDRQFLARMNYLNDQKMHREVRSACDENREPDWDRIAAANGIERDIVGPEDIDPDHLTWMRHNDFLTHDEEILSFYSSGNYSIASAGLLLTDAYFGGWVEDTDGLQGWWFKHGEICTLEKKKNATKTSGPLYRAESPGDNWFQFHLPDEGGQDVQFVDVINDLTEAARTDEQAAACADMLKEKAEETKEAVEALSEN